MKEPAEYDVYLMCNEKDRTEGDRLAWWLEYNGLRVWVESWERGSGRKGREALLHSSRLLILWSKRAAMFIT